MVYGVCDSPFDYTVQPGDQIDRLAARFSTTHDALVDDNELKDDGNKIYPKQVLQVKCGHEPDTFEVDRPEGMSLREIADLKALGHVRTMQSSNPQVRHPDRPLFPPTKVRVPHEFAAVSALVATNDPPGQTDAQVAALAPSQVPDFIYFTPKALAPADLLGHAKAPDKALSSFDAFTQLSDADAAELVARTLEHARSDASQRGASPESDERTLFEWLAYHASGERLGAISQHLAQTDEQTGEADNRKLRISLATAGLPADKVAVYEHASGQGPLPVHDMISVLWPLMVKVGKGNTNPVTGQPMADQTIAAAKQQAATATKERRPAAFQLMAVNFINKRYIAPISNPFTGKPIPSWHTNGEKWSLDLGPTAVAALKLNAHLWPQFLPIKALVATSEATAMAGVSWGSFVAKDKDLGTLRFQLSSDVQLMGYVMGLYAQAVKKPDFNTFATAEVSPLVIKGAYESPTLINIADLVTVRGMLYGQAGVSWIKGYGHGALMRPDGFAAYAQFGDSAGWLGYRGVAFIDVDFSKLKHLPEKIEEWKKDWERAQLTMPVVP